jgi:molybdopterin/thiamine biosynthesis adenylyltransferase
MCNEILGNYSKKEDQLMTAAFGTRLKRRLNRVMDALDFEYPDYERLDKDAEGQKRKRVAGALNKQATKSMKDDEEQLKKKKLKPELKIDASKKRKATALKQKTIDVEEETATTPSATDVEEILKVMTKSLPNKLSPLGPHLTKLFQKEKEPSKTKKAARPKNKESLQ